MASSSSNSNTKAMIKVNSPHVDVIEIDANHLKGDLPLIEAGPGDPEDLPEVYNKVANTIEGLLKSVVRMVDNLMIDGHKDLAMEIGNMISYEGKIPLVVVFTGIINEYAEAGKTMDALHVFRNISSSEHCAPNAYTYSVIIKALIADPDPNLLGLAKEFVLEMMGKGMQPGARTYMAVFEAGQDKMEEAKQFLAEMKANGFVNDRKSWKSMKQVLQGKEAVVKTIIDILFDNSENYSDESDGDNDAIKKHSAIFDQIKGSTDYYSPFLKEHVIEDDPDNPKDLRIAFDLMRRAQPVLRTVVRMIEMLKEEGFMSQALEIKHEFGAGDYVPEVVTHTGVIEYYAKHDEPKNALKVFLRMLSLGVAPNAYTYSVLVKTLAKDDNSLDDAKKYLLEMMDKEMQPNARTYIPVFKAFARLKEDNVKKGKEFLKEMKAKGFWANKKDVMKVLKGRKRHVIKPVIDILFGK